MAASDRFSQASLPYLLESDRLYDAVLAEDPGNLARMRNAALTKKYLGRHFDEAGDDAKSLESFRRAHAIDQRRIQAEPDNGQIQNDLAIDLGGIGKAHWRRGESAEAIDAYQKSLEIRQRISDADPKNAVARGRVAFMHHMLAKLYLSADRVSPAAQHVAQALTINEALSRLDRIYRAEHAGTLHTLAEIERRKGRLQAACAGDERAKVIFALVADHDLGSDQRTSKAEVEQALATCAKRGR